MNPLRTFALGFLSTAYAARLDRSIALHQRLPPGPNRDQMQALIDDQAADLIRVERKLYRMERKGKP